MKILVVEDQDGPFLAIKMSLLHHGEEEGNIERVTSLKDLSTLVWHGIGYAPDVVFWDGELTDGVTTGGLLSETVRTYPKALHVAMSSRPEILGLQMIQGCIMRMDKMEIVKGIGDVILTLSKAA